MIGSPPSDFVDAQGIGWAWTQLRESGFGTYVLSDPETALDQAVSRNEFDAPYFGTVWPSGRVLADQILEGALGIEGRVCDLGCGVGVAGLAALCMGCDVTFVDVAARAFPGVLAAAKALGLPAPRCVEAHWELDELEASFDHVLAADVLYHQIAVLPVARWSRQHLASGGFLWVADPGRTPAATFPDKAASVGLRLVQARDPVADQYSKASIAISQYEVSP